MSLNFGTPKIINIPFGTNGNLFIRVPIFKHITVYQKSHNQDKFIYHMTLQLFSG